ncbi:MAG TPA: hypothetical protein VGJ26_10565 [Pirellulales bacterium]|jgi:hypothetical protein
MSQAIVESRTVAAPIDLRMAAAGVAALTVVVGISLAFAQETGEMLTRNTVRLSLFWYATAICLMMRLRLEDWRGTTALGRIARWCWTLGLVTFLVHLGVAFHFYHQWSHAHAFDHTREVSGIGEGIYISYLFTWLWAADVAWWWTSPVTYVGRTPWIGRALHPFMLFIVFNGMVIYESGPIRWVGLVMFAVLAVAWWQSRGRSRSAGQ